MTDLSNPITPEQLAGNTERSQQTALFCQAALNIKKYPCLKWLHAIPNANSHKMVSEGVRAGVADVFLPKWSIIRISPVHVRQAHGLYIELKTEKRRKEKNGGLSKEQEEFGKDMIAAGYQWYVCYGWEEAWQRIEEYLNGSQIEY